MRALAQQLQGYFASLHQHQTTVSWQNNMLVFDQINALIGTSELLAQGARYDEAAQSSVQTFAQLQALMKD